MHVHLHGALMHTLFQDAPMQSPPRLVGSTMQNVDACKQALNDEGTRPSRIATA